MRPIRGDRRPTAETSYESRHSFLRRHPWKGSETQAHVIHAILASRPHPGYLLAWRKIIELLLRSTVVSDTITRPVLARNTQTSVTRLGYVLCCAVTYRLWDSATLVVPLILFCRWAGTQFSLFASVDDYGYYQPVLSQHQAQLTLLIEVKTTSFHVSENIPNGPTKASLGTVRPRGQ
jgi:hypothetical protein